MDNFGLCEIWTERNYEIFLILIIYLIIAIHQTLHKFYILYYYIICNIYYKYFFFYFPFSAVPFIFSISYLL